MRTADDASSSDRANANGDDAVAVDTTSTREEEPQPPAAPWTDERTKEERRLVFVANILLNLCGICLWAGLVIINALYAGIISTTGWDLSQVTLLFTLQIFTCFLCCPLWGNGLLVGLLISWSAPCNNTILSDVFSEATFPLAYGVAQMAEGSVSAFAPLVVAVIAEEVFGVSDLEVDVSCLTADQQADNVKGLGDAIFSVCCVGWGLCCIVVFGFYYFYPRESRALNPHLVAPTRKVSSDVDGELSTDAPAETAKPQGEPQAAGSGVGAEEAI